MPALRSMRRGVTLVEAAIAVALVAFLAAAAWPSWHGHLLRSRRVEATLALESIERAQLAYHERWGRYARRSDELPGTPASVTDGGRYRLTLSADGADGWRAVAVALNDQAEDRPCASIELRVQGAISLRGPAATCWSR